MTRRGQLGAQVAVASAAAILIVLPGRALAADAPFTSAPDLALGQDARPGGLASGDFDSDGNVDLAITDESRDRLHIRLGNGDGTFHSVDGRGAMWDARDVAAGDFNGDGIEDLAVAAVFEQGFSISVLLGTGSGAFVDGSLVEVADGSPAHAIAVGDLNGDGRDDLVASSEKHVSVRLGEGDGHFIRASDVPVGTGPLDVVVGDFDGNGTEDVATALHSSNGKRLGVLLGTGTGHLGSLTPVPVPGSTETLALGDFNADGRRDLAASVRVQERVAIRLGAGNGGFDDDAPEVPAPSPVGPIAVGDFDLDGNEDLAIGGGNAVTGALGVQLGGGDGSFSDGGAVGLGSGPADLAVADFNGDGRADVALSSFHAGRVHVRLGSGQSRRPNLLVNGTFELGIGARLPSRSPAVNGWTTTGGMTFVRYGVVPRIGFPNHRDSPRFGTGGLNFLWGGTSSASAGGISTAEQTVSVFASASAIDDGRATAELSAYLGGGWIHGDHMTARADFLDVSDTVIGSVTVGPVTHADRAGVTTMLRRAGRERVPAGTRRIRVTMTSTDFDGTSSAIADNVELRLEERAPEPVPPSPGGPSPGIDGPAAPSGGAEPAPLTPAPSTFGADSKVTVKLAASRVLARGPVPVLVTNGNAFAVSGTVSGERRRGRRVARLRGLSVSVAPGGRATVKLKLPAALQRELRARGKLTLRLSADVADPTGNRRIVRKQVAPRLKARGR